MADEIKIDLDELDAKKGTPAPKLNDLRPQTEEKPEKEVAVAQEETKNTLSADEGIAKLQKQLDTERNARISAEKRAQEAAEREAKALGETQTTQLDLVKNAITAVTQQNDALEGKYAEALSVQDFAAAAKINREMGVNSAKLIQLEAGKTALEKQPKPVARQAPDPVEQFVSNMTPKSAAWVRSHPEFVTDAKKNRMMIAAHELAIGHDLEPDSDEYFESVERTLALRKEEPAVVIDEDPMAAAAKPIVKPSPPAAPVSRSGNGAGGRPNVVTLSADERETAKMNGLTDEEYARNKMALKKEGRLN